MRGLRSWVQLPAPHGSSKLSVPLVSWDPVPSPHLFGYQTCADMHTDKTPIPVRRNNFLVLSQFLVSFCCSFGFVFSFYLFFVKFIHEYNVRGSHFPSLPVPTPPTFHKPVQSSRLPACSFSSSDLCVCVCARMCASTEDGGVGASWSSGATGTYELLDSARLLGIKFGSSSRPYTLYC